MGDDRAVLVDEIARLRAALAEARTALRASRSAHETTVGVSLRLQEMNTALVEELRLTLAAEQGKAEGAPSEGWVWDGHGWRKGDARVRRHAEGWEWWISGDIGFLTAGGVVNTARAAMVAADKATR